MLTVFSNVLRVTQPGVVIENVKAMDGIIVEAANVTIRNSYVTSSRNNVIDCNASGCKDLRVEDTTIVGKRPCSQSIGCRDFTACADGFKGHSNTTILDSYCHDLDKYTLSSGGTTHNDCYKGTGGSNIVIRGNNFNAIPNMQTSAIKISSQKAPVSNVAIENNWLNGGTNGVYITNQGQGDPTNWRIVGNTFDMNTTKFSPWRTDGSGMIKDNIVLNNGSDPAPEPEPTTQPQPDPAPEPDPTPTPTENFADVILQYPDGGHVIVPNGVYHIGDGGMNFKHLNGFKPSKPLVLVAESDGGVQVKRLKNAWHYTDFYIFGSSNITFVGIEFINIMVRVDSCSNINFYHTFHTYPPEASPVPTRKRCGNGIDPTTLHFKNSRNIKVYGANIDGAGHDGIKLGSGNDSIKVVGTSVTNVHHQGLQTQTTAEDAASCGHRATDKFHHSDAVQTAPGGTDNSLFKHGLTDRQMMLQVERHGASIKNLCIEDSVLSNKFSRQVIGARVKKDGASGRTMDIHLRNVKTYLKDTDRASTHINTTNSEPGAMTITKSNVQHIQGLPGGPTPAQQWQAENTYDQFPCFLSDVEGLSQYAGQCNR